MVAENRIALRVLSSTDTTVPSHDASDDCSSSPSASRRAPSDPAGDGCGPPRLIHAPHHHHHRPAHAPPRSPGPTRPSSSTPSTAGFRSSSGAECGAMIGMRTAWMAAAALKGESSAPRLQRPPSRRRRKSDRRARIAISCRFPWQRIPPLRHRRGTTRSEVDRAPAIVRSRKIDVIQRRLGEQIWRAARRLDDALDRRFDGRQLRVADLGELGTLRL